VPASFSVEAARRIVFGRGWGVLVDEDPRKVSAAF